MTSETIDIRGNISSMNGGEYNMGKGNDDYLLFLCCAFCLLLPSISTMWNSPTVAHWLKTVERVTSYSLPLNRCFHLVVEVYVSFRMFLSNQIMNNNIDYKSGWAGWFFSDKKERILFTPTQVSKIIHKIISFSFIASPKPVFLIVNSKFKSNWRFTQRIRQYPRRSFHTFISNKWSIKVWGGSNYIELFSSDRKFLTTWKNGISRAFSTCYSRF